jgi:hypothetical protein
LIEKYEETSLVKQPTQGKLLLEDFLDSFDKDLINKSETLYNEKWDD